MDEIVVQYKIELGKFKAEIKELIASLKKAEDTGKKGNDSLTAGYKKQEGIVNKLRYSIDNLTKMRNKSNDVGLINMYNKKIDEQNTKLKHLTSTQQKQQNIAHKSTSTFNQLGSSVAALGATMGIAFGVNQIISFASSSVKAASDLNEQLSKTQELFGSSTSKIVDWSKNTANSLGQSQTQALEGAANFAIFGRAAGLSGDKLVDFSTGFTALASDLASFNNTSPEEAMLAIGAALRGEAEPIRKYGILLDDATLRQEALTLGIIDNIKTALTPQQKVLAAQAAIYKQSSAAQGDFARTSDGLANQQRILSANFANLKTELGSGLLPVVNDVVGGLNALVNMDMVDMGRVIDQNAKHSLEIMNNLLISLGLKTRKYIDTLTDREKAEFKIIAATDAQIQIEREKAIAMGASSDEYDKFVESVRKGEIENTFKDLIKVLDITKEQFAELVSITDKYGISARIAADQIMLIKQATGVELENAFLKFNKTLGVSRKDWDDYIGKVKEIEPLQEDLSKSTAKMVGPYDQLTNSVSNLTKKMLDYITLGLDATHLDRERFAIQERLNGINEKNNSLLNSHNAIVMQKNALVAMEVVLASELSDTHKKTYEELLKENRAILDNELAIIRLNDTAIKTDKERLESAQTTVSQILSINQMATDFIEGLYDLESQLLQNKYETDIKNAGDNEAKKLEISAEFENKKLQLRKQFAVPEFLLRTAEIVASTAAAVMQQYATLPLPAAAIASGFIIATGVVQEAIAAAQLANVLALADGTSEVKGGIPGKDSVHALLMPKEAVIKADENMKMPGMAKAWNDGNINEFIMSKYVAPALKQQEAKLQQDFATNLANSMIIQQGQMFDDIRLKRALDEGNNINKHGFKHLIDVLGKRSKKRGGYA